MVFEFGRDDREVDTLAISRACFSMHCLRFFDRKFILTKRAAVLQRWGD